MRKALLLASLIPATTLMSLCQSAEVDHVKSTLRAPAYPLVTIDPYTSGWMFADTLYSGTVKHWTGKDFPLTGAVSVDGQIYRFMGTSKLYKIVAPSAEQSAWEAAYTFRRPAAGWYRPDFNDAGWSRSAAAFGTEEQTAVRTLWEVGDIWVRREVTLSDEDIALPLYLNYSHDDDIVIYLNGVEIVNTGYVWGEGKLLPLPEAATQTLKPGKNVIAAHCTNRGNGALVDFGLSAELPATRHLEQTAQQTSVDVQATQTRYTFACGAADLTLTFTTPLLMSDLDLLSRPVSYISYQVASNDGNPHDVELFFEAAAQWAANTPYQEMETSSMVTDGLVFLYTGVKEQKILGRKGDDVRIDWGYFYMVAEEENTRHMIGFGNALRNAFATKSDLTHSEMQGTSVALIRSLGKTKQASGKIMLGYDDIFSIQYFGENLRPYWNRSGKESIVSQFRKANAEYEGVIGDCNRFDAELMRQATAAGGRKYAELCALAYRQAIAAHKLVQAPNGDLLFFSKENFSNGSIGTVDITYPSAPLFLLYSPELCKGLLNHIFYYSESGKWKKPFAAHDVGTYPLANGQTYGGDMPVEESGNMLIVTAAIADREGNAKYAEKHWDVLTTWTNYLVDKGLDPENQLCTDDFAGHFAHNANLSIKAILGIASYGKLAAMLGKQDVADVYTAKAREMAQKWVAMADDCDHYRLTFDRKGTWSQKYNLVWDKLLKLNIFPNEVAEKEIAYYLTRQNAYGLPLDNRETYTKADWIVWTATMAGSRETFEAFIEPLHAFVNETPDRVPMTDWYFTDRPRQRGFQARSVVGGFFIKMLEEN
ncbi:MAG: DUF4965 domain-containing protein [Prevotellaceae bacterium]|jgi:hypothetical protein|nr:DUF4965 domain-containing protein [Prevotellaceae bacterium]